MAYGDYGSLTTSPYDETPVQPQTPLIDPYAMQQMRAIYGADDPAMTAQYNAQMNPPQENVQQQPYQPQPTPQVPQLNQPGPGAALWPSMQQPMQAPQQPQVPQIQGQTLGMNVPNPTSQPAGGLGVQTMENPNRPTAPPVGTPQNPSWQQRQQMAQQQRIAGGRPQMMGMPPGLPAGSPQHQTFQFNPRTGQWMPKTASFGGGGGNVSPSGQLSPQTMGTIGELRGAIEQIRGGPMGQAEQQAIQQLQQKEHVLDPNGLYDYQHSKRPIQSYREQMEDTEYLPDGRIIYHHLDGKGGETITHVQAPKHEVDPNQLKPEHDPARNPVVAQKMAQDAEMHRAKLKEMEEKSTEMRHERFLKHSETAFKQLEGESTARAKAKSTPDKAVEPDAVDTQAWEERTQQLESMWQKHEQARQWTQGAKSAGIDPNVTPGADRKGPGVNQPLLDAANAAKEAGDYGAYKAMQVLESFRHRDPASLTDQERAAVATANQQASKYYGQ